jgi:hypothetical protein
MQIPPAQESGTPRRATVAIKPRIIGQVVQSLAKLCHRRVEAVIEIYERIGGLQRFLQSFASDRLLGLLQQHH